jgi:dienelactone hydrolase
MLGDVRIVAVRVPGRRLLLVAALLLGSACAGDDPEPVAIPDETTTTTADVPLEVEVGTETFVDSSRPTDAGSETPASDSRTLVTRIAHPTTGGPYPLIVLSHGFTGHPDEFTDTVPMWAADGFVVASPAFPLTNREVPGAGGNIGDVVNQPGDVSFVIDEVLAAGDDPDSELFGLVDPEAIGVVGHSLGGATTWAVSFNTATRDPRIDSVAIFAGVVLDMPGGTFEYGSGLPLLVLHGDADPIPMDGSRAAYEQATSPKWFVTLLGGDHVPPFTDIESVHDELVTETLLAFWHGTLDGDADALDRVTDTATDPELAAVLHE